MSVQSDLYDLLANDANVSGIVGTDIYPGVRPQDAGTPCLVYHEVATEGTFTLGGVAIDEQSSYQLAALAVDHPALVQLVAAVRLLAGSSSGDIKRLGIEEGPAGYDFTLSLFTQVLQLDISL